MFVNRLGSINGVDMTYAEWNELQSELPFEEE